jgi:hypothetical protein
VWRDVARERERESEMRCRVEVAALGWGINRVKSGEFGRSAAPGRKCDSVA